MKFNNLNLSIGSEGGKLGKKKGTGSLFSHYETLCSSRYHFDNIIIHVGSNSFPL